MLRKACKRRDIPCFVVNTKTAYVADKDIDKGTVTISNLDADENVEEFEGRNTCVICRAGAIDDSAGLALMAAFEVAGSFMINTRESMLTADNKLSTTILFEQFGIPQPKTAFVSNEKQIESALEKIGGKFPVVIKTLTGTQGIGISIVDSLESLTSNIQSLFKHNAELLIQEFLKIDYDIRTFVVNGVSKAYAMTGWRLGYGAGPKNLIKEISKIQSQSTTHTSSISQAAAIEALNNSDEFINKNKKIFQERRDLIFSKLKDFSPLQVFLPEGSFYVYVCCNDLMGKKKDDGTEIKNDINLSDYFLDEGVAVVPGEAFGCSNFFRISFATSNENIIEGCDKIVSACKKLK